MSSRSHTLESTCVLFFLVFFFSINMTYRQLGALYLDTKYHEENSRRYAGSALLVCRFNVFMSSFVSQASAPKCPAIHNQIFPNYGLFQCLFPSSFYTAVYTVRIATLLRSLSHRAFYAITDCVHDDPSQMRRISQQTRENSCQQRTCCCAGFSPSAVILRMASSSSSTMRRQLSSHTDAAAAVSSARASASPYKLVTRLL